MTTRAAVLRERWGLGLSRDEAAAYIGVSTVLFDEMVSDGRMPKPKPINSRLVWDRRRIDTAFAALPDIGGASDGDIWSDPRA